MQFWNCQIINPEKFRIPSFNISPFSTEYLHDLKKRRITIKNDGILKRKFGNFEFTLSGKTAIAKALSFYKLTRNDEIYIVTSTGNLYVSSCVTGEIEKFCNWSRELSDKTKLIFVIHEFGLIYDRMEMLIKLNIPIIEDMAMSMFSNNENNKAGNYGDFTIYSLPKFFPIQFGGILKYNKIIFTDFIDNSKPFQLYLNSATKFYMSKEKQIIKKRLINDNHYTLKLSELGLIKRFNFSKYETPSVFMFSSNNLNLDDLKIFMQNNGVECSVFYGESSFFLPVHQNLKIKDIDFIINIIKYFIHENK